MREHERLFVGGVVSLIIILAPGFLVHSDPRFAGSLAGGILGIVAALLMVVALAYPLIKRIDKLRRSLPMRSVLLSHIVAGVLGPLLAMFHSGHKFDSPIGLGMIVLILVLVTSGFVGRYYLNQVSSDIRDDRQELVRLETAYSALNGSTVRSKAPTEGAFAEAIADVEQAIGAREALKRAFGVWMFFHVGATLAFVLLLGLHVWSSVYLGLRWLR